MSNTTASNTAKVKADTARIDRLKERQRSPPSRVWAQRPSYPLAPGEASPDQPGRFASRITAAIWQFRSTNGSQI